MWIQHPVLPCSFKNSLSSVAAPVNIFNEKIVKTNVLNIVAHFQWSSVHHYFVFSSLPAVVKGRELISCKSDSARVIPRETNVEQSSCCSSCWRHLQSLKQRVKQYQLRLRNWNIFNNIFIIEGNIVKERR